MVQPMALAASAARARYANTRFTADSSPNPYCLKYRRELLTRSKREGERGLAVPHCHRLGRRHANRPSRAVREVERHPGCEGAAIVNGDPDAFTGARTADVEASAERQRFVRGRQAIGIECRPRRRAVASQFFAIPGGHN